MVEKDEMRVSVLASSSSGNTTFIETPTQKNISRCGDEWQTGSGFNA